MEERGQDQTRRKSGTATSAQAHFRFQSVWSGPHQITNYFNKPFQSILPVFQVMQLLHTFSYFLSY